MNNRIYVTKEVAEILRISEEHLRCLLRTGEIKAYKEGRRGGYRIMHSDIESYIARKMEWA